MTVDVVYVKYQAAPPRLERRTAGTSPAGCAGRTDEAYPEAEVVRVVLDNLNLAGGLARGGGPPRIRFRKPSPTRKLVKDASRPP